MFKIKEEKKFFKKYERTVRIELTYFVATKVEEELWPLRPKLFSKSLSSFQQYKDPRLHTIMTYLSLITYLYAITYTHIIAIG